MSELYLQHYVVKVRNRKKEYCQRCNEQIHEYIANGQIRLVVWYNHEVVYEETI